MQPSRRKRRDIFGAFYMLILIAVGSVTLVAISLSASQTEERAVRERLEQFHLRSTMLTSEASRQTGDLRLQLAALFHPASGTPASSGQPASNRAVRTLMRGIGQALDSIVALEAEWRQPIDPFAETLARATRQHRVLSREMSGAPGTPADMLGNVEALKLSLFQLERLHAVAAQELFNQIELTGRNSAQRTSLMVAGVLIVSGLIIARIISLLRARLREHEQTEQMLLERERQLQQSTKMEALGSLVGGVAHDFNNLLTAILGHTELLQGETDHADPRQSTILEIQKAGERAAGLTRQLLVFSRQQAVEPVVVDLNLMIRDLEPMLRRLIPEDITLEFDLDSGVGNVEIDPVQIEQVLVNLTVNARDAMGDGGLLTVRTSNVRIDGADSRVPSPGYYVQIQLKDSGCGMPPDILSRVFDPFFTTKEPGKGTGLGLATVHGTVSKAGGFVEVQSEVGVGSRFEVYLPHCDKQATEHATDAVQDPVSGGSETVLVAEDEAQIRRLVVRMLHEAGYQVLEASDGNEALRVCAEHSGEVHLILSDVVMPGMRGPEMVQRALEFHPSARVIFISGYAQNENLEEGSLSGAPLLTKPFRLQQLLELVRQELNTARGVKSSPYVPTTSARDLGEFRRH